MGIRLSRFVTTNVIFDDEDFLFLDPGCSWDN